MHKILILYTLLNSQNTMYGLSKSIEKTFGFITKPSFGTLQPALKTLEKNSYIKSDNFFTEGGKPYIYYSITEQGKNYLTELIQTKFPNNPVQLIPEIKIRIICSTILSKEAQKNLFKNIKSHIMTLKTKTEKALNSDTYSTNYQARLLLDNIICEYKNLYNLTEGLEKCPQ